MSWFDDSTGGGTDWVSIAIQGANLLNSYNQANAAKDAVSQQAGAANQANATNLQIYNQNRADQAPWRQQGAAAVNQMGYLMGLGGGMNPRGFNPVAASQDVIPAAINLREAQMLKAKGGAGIQDPQTGVYHFYQDKGEDGSDGGNGTGNDGDRGSRGSGNEARGGDGRGWGNDTGNDGNDSWSRAYEAMGNSAQSGGRGYGSGRLNEGTQRMGYDVKRGMTGMLTAGPIGLVAGIRTGTYNPGDSYNPGGQRQFGDIERDRNGGTLGFTGQMPAYGAPGVYGAPTASNIPGESQVYAPGTNGGGMNAGDFARRFTMADFQADPGYAFRMQEGQKALERSEAARGGLNSGAVGKALLSYGQGLGSQEYGNAYGRWTGQNTDIFNRYAALAGLGQTATQATGNNANTYANAYGQNVTGAGNAQAAGTIGAANAWSNGLNNWLKYSGYTGA